MSTEAKDQDRAMAVFRDLVARLDRASFDYAIGGGLCTDHWTGGVWIGDIDVVDVKRTHPRS